MQLAFICAYCNHIHTSDNEAGKDATVVIDFKQKQITFMCQNNGCRKENMFSFDTWKDKAKASPLPRIRIT